MLHLDFEWDENKNKSNIKKHGIGFEQAKEIFSTVHIIIPAKSEIENRYIIIGKYQDVLYIAIIYTERNNVTRIISARRAKTKEIELFEQFILLNNTNKKS
jgi:uncharacterized protein